MRGNSGAVVNILTPWTVSKRYGTNNLREEARLVAHLGTAVCPMIVSVDDDSYVMERLQTCPSPRDEIGLLARLTHVRSLLQEYVWSRRAFAVEPPSSAWCMETRRWCREHAEWIDPGILDRLYANVPDRTTLIHGDPTLSNMMLDEACRVRLIDPRPPRPGVPQLVEVDLGKLLQSAAGWERLLDPAWGVGGMATARIFAASMSEYYQPRALFWAAFACARVAARGGAQERVQWARMTSGEFMEMLHALRV